MNKTNNWEIPQRGTHRSQIETARDNEKTLRPKRETGVSVTGSKEAWLRYGAESRGVKTQEQKTGELDITLLRKITKEQNMRAMKNNLIFIGGANLKLQKDSKILTWSWGKYSFN